MLSQLRTAVRNPRLAGLKLYRRYQRSVRSRGIDIPAADWDTLLLLDACRYDLFVKYNTLSGDLSRVISKGSHTTEFLTENFQGREFPEVVYVSATPQIHATGVNTNFHDTIAVWENRWDDDLRTVPPKAMADATRKARSRPASPDHHRWRHLRERSVHRIGLGPSQIGRSVRRGSLGCLYREL